MLDARTPFLNPDGTVQREWFLFLTTLNAAAGNPTKPNPTTTNDVRRIAEEEGPLIAPSFGLTLDARKTDEGRPYAPPLTADLGARKAAESVGMLPPLLGDVGARKAAESAFAPPPLFIPQRLSRVIATDTNAQSIPNNAFTALTNLTVTVNQGGNFNATTGVYTCPSAGQYDVRAAIRYASATWGSTQVDAIGVAVNGTVIYSNTVSGDSGTINAAATGAWLLNCNANDQITVQAFQNTGAALALNGLAINNWLSIMQLP